jgi:undecaprenyl-diphosphatase
MLPKTIAFVSLLTVALILLSLTVRARWTLPFDLRATLGLQRWTSPLMDAAMKWLTWMGNSKTMVVLAVACAIIAWIGKDLRASLFIGLSLLALPANMVLKNIFDRERPGEKEVKVHPGPRWGFSYPSGHSMGSAAFYGFLAVLVFLHVPDLRTRWLMMTPLISLPPLIGLSRIYLGAHWLSDVVGGITGGAILISILAVLYPV